MIHLTSNPKERAASDCTRAQRRTHRLLAVAASATIAAVLANAPAFASGDQFVLSSQAFDDGGTLPLKNAGRNRLNLYCVGQNVSPPLQWKNPPKGTKSYALILVDVDGHFGLGGVHWVGYGIPTSVSGFDEGQFNKPSSKFISGKGGQGQQVYAGPCPPPWSSTHHMVFTLIATDLDPKALPAGLTREELLEKLKDHAKGEAGLVALFKRP